MYKLGLCLSAKTRVPNGSFTIAPNHTPTPKSGMSPYNHETPDQGSDPLPMLNSGALPKSFRHSSFGAGIQLVQAWFNILVTSKLQNLFQKMLNQD